MRNVVLEFENITKIYPGVRALENVSICFERGEVHALVGENGAGKSTLIKTLSGAIEPTMGSILIDGNRYSSLTPAMSRKLGVAVVYQELVLVPALSAAENIFLGDFIRHGWFCDTKAMHDHTRELFKTLGIDLNPQVRIEQLTTGYQQMIEIAKAVSKNARILVLDEPSAPLTVKEVEDLFGIIKRLKDQGVTIIYISHRMEEVFRIADRVSVLRDGQHVITKKICETNREELIRYMVGRTLDETYPEHHYVTKEVVLELQKITGNGVKDISFKLHRGEILGLGGLIGAGRTELAEMLFGHVPVKSGKILLHGRQVSFKKPKHAANQGLSLVPEDRKGKGLLLDLSVKQNIELPSIRRLARGVFVNEKASVKLVDDQIKNLRIKTPHIHQFVRSLSGGNQQKVVLGKWLATDTEILILDEPTRGIDVGAKKEIYQLMVEFLKDGKSIIMISSDMQELMGMSDRIIVLSKGRLIGEIEREEFTQERVLNYAAGIGAD